MHPLTRVTARDAGWQGRVPMQHRTAHTYIYCSRFATDADASDALLDNIAKPVSERTAHAAIHKRTAQEILEPELRRARRRRGLSGTARIHRHPSDPERHRETDYSFFPADGIDPATLDEYNRLTGIEFDHIRDFLILHYHAAGRTDSAVLGCTAGIWKFRSRWPTGSNCSGAADAWFRRATSVFAAELAFAFRGLEHRAAPLSSLCRRHSHRRH